MTGTYEDNLDQFTISSRREILFYLRQLINDGERVSVMFDGGHDALLTVLLDVDDEESTLIFDWGGSEETNRRLLKAEKVFFVASPHGVRNQFATQKIWEVSHAKRRAFATRLPDKYVRLQRREFFRLLLPMTQRPPCRFKTADGKQDWEMSVVDIGIGGVGLESPKTELPFTQGEILTRASIDLKNFGVLHADLEVRHVEVVQRGVKTMGRLGCCFSNLGHAQENQLQRFITMVQREERAKMGL